MKPSIFLATLFAIITEANPASITGRKPRFGPLPEGSGDGWYEGSLLPNGNTEWSYLGPKQSQSQRRGVEITSSVTKAILDGPPSGDAYFCSGWKVKAKDAEEAVEGFAGLCGNGRRFESVMAYAVGTAVAYGCSYGNPGVTCAHGAYNATGFLRGLQHACGKGNTGFFFLAKEAVSYGVSNLRDYYC
ncbi:hypothetical protein CP533_1363 [Ophiocordyceps camponoti-saundersi (nom. inval.)]|nr:hypothetical protein CP533_1363 [Ophiocordyceps camponoti-saundersi (nom. inval.)]